MSENTITREHVQAILQRALLTRSSRVGDKTTVVHVQLANGFEITESSACVDPANYSEEIGRQVCWKRIEDRIWLLEGWRLACRLGGEP